MDNAAFRSLVSNSTQDGSNTNPSRKPTNLGSRTRSSIPMTPRNVPHYNAKSEFARQVADHTSSSNEPPLKRFKSSIAPKGTKLGAGYVDRAQLRKGQGEDRADEEDQASRLKNLEEQFKLGQIDQAQFEKLRDQIGVGGDVGSTHLVKGLDWKLLEKVRRGEDVTQTARQDANDQHAENAPEVDVDEELERALEKEVVADRKEKTESEVGLDGEQHQPLTRDEILRRFREQRNVPRPPTVPALNEKFKRVAAPEKPGKKKYIETVNGRRREVLIISNKDGTTKRKTRWIDPEDVKAPSQQPLGMELPAEIAARQKALREAEANEDHNEDIFADAGDDYDPLADIQSGSDEDDEAQEGQDKVNISTNATQRNYFSTGTAANDRDTRSDDPMTSDPTILAALKRAAHIRQREETAAGELGGSSTDQSVSGMGAKSSTFLAKLREQERQDAADLDYGFGESRFGDEDEEDAGPLYEDEDGDKKKGSRKRGPKKRKGNKDDVQDVMSVLERKKKS